MKRMIVYISLILALVAIPTQSRGQYVTVEKTQNNGKVAIIYAEGMPLTAIWELGRILRDEKTGATIRHTPDAGIDNINVNSKLPFRFIVAPTDTKVGTLSVFTDQHDWAEAMGFGSEENNSLKAGTIAQVIKGCREYSPGTVSGSGSQTGAFTSIGGIKNWRLPTQRELALMYLFRDAIDQAYINIFTIQEPAVISRLDKLKGVYWSSTENDATSAYYFNFTNLDAHAAVKTAKCKVRCVADY